MYVEVNRVHSCEHGRNEDIVIETLRINGSSANEFNKTAVQCFAFAKTGGQTESIYSRFGIMLINGTYVRVLHVYWGGGGGGGGGHCHGSSKLSMQ